MEFMSNVHNGLTIKELLDKVDIPDKMSGQAKVGVEMMPNPESAFLGPKLWDKPISLQQFNEDDFFVMNIDDFLAENEIDKDKLGNALKSDEGSPEPEEMRCTSLSKVSMTTNMSEEVTNMTEEVFNIKVQPDSPVHVPENLAVPSPRPCVIVATKDCKKNVLPKGNNNFLYAESKRARLEREKAEKARKMEVELEFAPEDLALATVPGADFNPKERAFDMEELRPQPIIRKRPKLYVAEREKDERYWEKRGKNNVAARRSREARRLKENQIALRAAYLEKENSVLKRQLEEANFEATKNTMEINILKQKLANMEKLFSAN